MKEVAVVTDSVACVPKELVDSYNIHVVPVNLVIDNRSYRDGIDISAAEVYENLKRWKELPTTSAPSPGTFLEVFKDLSRQTDSILCITLASKLSAVFDSVCRGINLANKAIPHINIRVLDSRTATGAQGFVAVAAARSAANGDPIDQVILAAEKMRSRVHMVSMLDTMYYLAKGGRIPKAAAWVGSLLRIKPILQIKPDEGVVSPLDKPRTRRKGIERLIEILRERVGDERLHVNIQHANSLNEAEKLMERILSEFDCSEAYITDFTPVMGTHTGPGLLGLSFYCGE
ncbi:DegV family protein [Chloroflexota bacterium]